MTSHTRRYVFLEYNTLKSIKFKKLEKVSDKVFIFVGSDVEDIPFDLVKDMQRMGSNIKWVEVSAASQNDLNYHICFLMGKLHEKISGDVEFAILSNDTTFDPLVNFINSTGRSCIRVRQQSIDFNQTNVEPPISSPANPAVTDIKIEKADISTRLFGERNSETLEISESSPVSDVVLVEETAKETVRRLIRSGNRPSDLGLLKSYILLHNQELSQHGNLEKIIKKLEDTNEIKLNNEQVIYNF